MATDNFAEYRTGLDSPGEDGFDITPNNDNDLPQVTRALYITGAGDVRFTTRKGTTLTWSFPANYLFTMRVSRVHVTGTTATGIKGIV
jgi:hypothetical protein